MTTTNASNILIVEDDLDLGFLLMEYLESKGYSVKICKDGALGWKYYLRYPFDLCILDVMVPKLDGFNFAKKLKENQTSIPFIFLTARSLKEDKLRGYSLGAEDYLIKPFDVDELLCKIQVILRRKKEEKEANLPTYFNLGQYQFDYERQELLFDNQIIRLTEKENEVLRLLCLNQNKILKREDAVEKIYGKKDYFLGRSFDVFISKIRKLLKDDPSISIDNVYKVGFILNVQ